MDLTRALDKLYLPDKPNCLEIIAVCSINNIGDDYAPVEPKKVGQKDE
jgi:hypothetical protein